jgi:hypothetical protein
VTFDEFYNQDYLPRHANKYSRLLHLVGLVASAIYAGAVVWLAVWWLLLLAPVPTYLVAWLGHLVAHNHPTFFAHPVFSFFGYWNVIGGMLTGKI